MQPIEDRPDRFREPESWTRSFWALMATQFQGAFSDNAYKNLVVYLILGVALPKDQREILVVVVGLLFSIPFILFSMTGGFLGDRFSKRSVTAGTKVMEIGVMLVALAALGFASLPLQIAAVFLLSTQAALFGPSKYGLLPEILPQSRLSWGNGVLELGTFVAIITGTMAAGFMAEAFAGRQYWSGAILVALAAVGLTASLAIRRTPPADPARPFRLNPISELLSEWKYVREDRVLYLAVLGNTYFWFLAMLLQTNIIFYGNDVLHLQAQGNAYLQASVAIGIGIGSLAAGYLSGGKIEYGLIPLGAAGITIFGAALGHSGIIGFVGVAALLGLIGFFAGFFAVPINALIQHRPDPARKSGVIAAANLISFIGIFLASGTYYAFTAFARFGPKTIFLLSAGMTLGATIYVTRLLPDSLIRLLLWLATNTIYRIRVDGRENVPSKGGALLVSNHLSFVDALLLIASTDRFIRFLIFKDIYELPFIKPFARIIQAIPISSKQRPREMIAALREASETIKAGGIVCIFAEGQITRVGHLLPFRRGFERIMKGVDAPIIPVNLDGVWGSIFSFERQRFFLKVPHRTHRITVSFGQPMPATATAFEVRQAVQELESKAFAYRKERMKPLGQTIVKTARRHWFRFAMADSRVPRLRFGPALIRSILLARRFRPFWRDQEMAGILLPPCVPGALVNTAALLAGKPVVNLNYTASDEILRSCAAQCNMKYIVTSRAFLERARVSVPGEPVFLEDLAAKPSLGEKLSALALALACPASHLYRFVGGKAAALGDLATVVFSSGSTGDPKGVMLSHYNIAANIEQIGQIFALDKGDRILGILPFFHSFGFTATLMLPSVLGIGVVYHPNPFDAGIIGGLVSQYGATFLMATPTFLQTYIRRCAPEDFGSLEYVVAGAEKLPERIAQAFDDHFGIRPLEGYGCTECSPAVAINTRDFRAAGFRQVGSKRGTIGHPMPGMSVRIVDPETMSPLPAGTPGLLLVRGPNVMKGYLNKPEKTAEVFHDGWYITGDIATVDEDGFIEITDRLSRFSKIAGEMVPHIKVEEKLHEIAGATEQTFVVTGVPDEKRGERLVVVHRLSDDDLKTCLAKLQNAGLPNIWIPARNQFFHVDDFPHLGSGKLDLRKIREVAMQVSNAAPELTNSIK